MRARALEIMNNATRSAKDGDLAHLYRIHRFLTRSAMIIGGAKADRDVADDAIYTVVDNLDDAAHVVSRAIDAIVEAEGDFEFPKKPPAASVGVGWGVADKKIVGK